MSKTVPIDDILASTDIARLFRVGNPAVSNWKQRHSDFPKPFATVGSGHIKLYRRSEVVAWYRSRLDPELLRELLA